MPRRRHQRRRGRRWREERRLAQGWLQRQRELMLEKNMLKFLNDAERIVNLPAKRGQEKRLSEKKMNEKKTNRWFRNAEKQLETTRMMKNQ
jgi:hypothetical protein